MWKGFAGLHDRGRADGVYVSTEHLLGILADASGDMSALLRSHGVEPDAIRTIIARTIRRGTVPDIAARIRPYTSRAQHALQTAAEEAAAFRHGAVDLLHLLLALSTDQRAIAAQILADVGVQAEWLRQELHNSPPRQAEAPEWS